jgi:hypothetical protein
MLGLLALADLEIDDVINAENTQELKNTLQGAGNYLSRQILKYWSQNTHIQLQFELHTGRAGDREDLRTGTVLWTEVYDAARRVTVRIGARSRGFIWFFSFLAWFSQQQQKGEPLILVLDEPDMFLHAKGQYDLLRFIQEQLAPHHQVVYSTHSPFMIDPRRLDRVRVVFDRSMDALQGPLARKDEGTKVLPDVALADEATIFPLRLALAYNLTQGILDVTNSLVIGSVPDMIYLTTMSDLLRLAGESPLDERWTMVPIGSLDRLGGFVTLAESPNRLNLAALLDARMTDWDSMASIHGQKLLPVRVRTYGEFTGTVEATVEDMFDVDFIMELVNASYNKDLPKALTIADLPESGGILSRLTTTFEQRRLTGQPFNRYRPAKYLADHVSSLRPRLSYATLQRFRAAFGVLNALVK